MKTFIGTKIVQAEQMGKNDFDVKFKGAEVSSSDLQKDGYHVKYDNGYDSWSPKGVFEQAYRLITNNEASLVDGNESQQEDDINE